MRIWLKTLREKRNFTQLAVAEKLCISESYYNLIKSLINGRINACVIGFYIVNAFGIA